MDKWITLIFLLLAQLGVAASQAGAADSPCPHTCATVQPSQSCCATVESCAPQRCECAGNADEEPVYTLASSSPRVSPPQVDYLAAQAATPVANPGEEGTFTQPLNRAPPPLRLSVRLARLQALLI